MSCSGRSRRKRGRLAAELSVRQTPGASLNRLSVLAASGVIFVAIGGAGLLSALYLRGDDNWRPVELPLPAPGFPVASPFRVASEGAFHLEAVVPDGSGDDPIHLPSRPDVPCLLTVVVEADNGFRLQEQVRRFHHAGRHEFGGTDEYWTDPVFTLKRGEYVLRLIPQQDAPLLREHGATLQFTRYTHPAEWMLAGMLARGGGTAALITGLLLVTTAAVARHTRERAIAGAAEQRVSGLLPSRAKSQVQPGCRGEAPAVASPLRGRPSDARPKAVPLEGDPLSSGHAPGPASELNGADCKRISGLCVGAPRGSGP